jgi:hypothetical protein
MNTNIDSYQTFKHALESEEEMENKLTIVDRLLHRQSSDACGWILYYLQKHQNDPASVILTQFVATIIIQYHLHPRKPDNPCLQVLWGVLELGAELIDPVMRMVIDEDDPAFLESVVQFPQIRAAVSEELIGYVFGNLNLEHDFELCKILEEAFAFCRKA